MEQRLSLVTLGVRDLAASRAFYQAPRLEGITAEQRRAWRSSSAVAWCSRCGPARRWWRTPACERAGAGLRQHQPCAERAQQGGRRRRARRSEEGRRHHPEARHGSVLGRLHRLLRGPRRLRLGGRLEPRLRDLAGRRRQAAALIAVALASPVGCAITCNFKQLHHNSCDQMSMAIGCGKVHDAATWGPPRGSVAMDGINPTLAFAVLLFGLVRQPARYDASIDRPDAQIQDRLAAHLSRPAIRHSCLGASIQSCGRAFQRLAQQPRSDPCEPAR